MNDCATIREKLSAFLDNELGAGERDLIEKHLLHCRCCANETESLRKISALLDVVPDQEPRPLFAFLTVRRVAAWRRCAFVKEHISRPVVSGLRAGFALLVGPAGRRFPSNGYLRNFDDFPPESFSSVYVALIQDERP
jgi:anti-sigma factor RsiW